MGEPDTLSVSRPDLKLPSERPRMGGLAIGPLATPSSAVATRLRERVERPHARKEDGNEQAGGLAPGGALNGEHRGQQRVDLKRGQRDRPVTMMGHGLAMPSARDRSRGIQPFWPVEREATESPG